MSEALEPFALIFISVGEDVHTVALGLGVEPLADVRFSVCALPNAVTVLYSLLPLSVVDFAVFPLVDALSICLSVFMSAVVEVAVCKDFVPTAVSAVLEPLSFVNTAVLVDEDAEALALPGDRV